MTSIATPQPWSTPGYAYTRREIFWTHDSPARLVGYQYYSDPEGHEHREFLCGVAGKDDASPIHNSQSCYGGHYDSRCSCCFLGFMHTDANHEQAVLA